MLSSPFKSAESNAIDFNYDTQGPTTPRTAPRMYFPSTPNQNIYELLAQDEATRYAALSPDRARVVAEGTPRQHGLYEQDVGDEEYNDVFAAPLPAWAVSPGRVEGRFEYPTDPMMDLAASPAVADVWPESRASSVTPTDEASSDDEGDAVVVHTTNTVTEHIRPQRRAAGRKAADAGPCYLPLPVNRDELIECLLAGLHPTSILPSKKRPSGIIVCQARHKLLSDGIWRRTGICGQESETAENYRRHVIEKHLGADRRTGLLGAWVAKHRPGAKLPRATRKYQVVGARRMSTDQRERTR